MQPLKGLSQPAQPFPDCRERSSQIVEVVGDAAAKLAHCFHALRCSELFLGFVQALLRLHALGHDACDFGEPYNLAVVIANCI
jgi:hypothetical protein